MKNSHHLHDHHSQQNHEPEHNLGGGTESDVPHGHLHLEESGHEHSQVHEGNHGHGSPGWLVRLFQRHSHSHHAITHDPALANERGIWALKVSLIGLLVTAVFQVGVVAISGSVALLADTLHNFSDALTALPLWLAFALARRPANRRFTYGYGRAEDLAGLLIVLMIFGSALLVFFEAVQKIIHHQPMTNLGWVAAASIIGFVGNELVAVFRIRVGREIGSAALVADGLHARTDGLTSLGVLAGVVGVWLGIPLADPLIGFAIGLTILMVSWGAAREMWYRIMDAADPEMIKQIEEIALREERVLDVHAVTLRWLGHRQRGKLHITVDCQLPTVESHQVAENVRHALFHALPALAEVTIHVDPCECDQAVTYHPTAHHFSKP